MGWGGGTEIFDSVAKSLLELNVGTPCHSHEAYLREVLDPLLEVLKYQDWDNHQESIYWDDPTIGMILGNTFEDEDDYEDDDWMLPDERDE